MLRISLNHRQSKNSCLHASVPPSSPPSWHHSQYPLLPVSLLDGLCYDKFNWGLSSHNISVNIRLAKSVNKRKRPYCMRHNVCLCKWIAKRHFDSLLLSQRAWLHFISNLILIRQLCPQKKTHCINNRHIWIHAWFKGPMKNTLKDHIVLQYVVCVLGSWWGQWFLIVCNFPPFGWDD